MLFIQNIGPMEIALIVGLALLIFGPKKLPELGRSLGKGLREFKKGTSGFMDSINQPEPEPQTKTLETPAQPIAAPVQPVAAPVQAAAAAKATAKSKSEPEEMVIDLEKEGKSS